MRGTESYQYSSPELQPRFSPSNVENVPSELRTDIIYFIWSAKALFCVTQAARLRHCAINPP